MTKTTTTINMVEDLTVELTVLRTERCLINLGWDTQLVADAKTAAALVELLARCLPVTSSYVGGTCVLTPSTRKPTIELGAYQICDRAETEAAIELERKTREERKAAA